MSDYFIPSATVRRSDNPQDPFIYLFVNKEWYCYNPGERLGGGAMGDVYLGYRCKTRDPIAVKRVKPCYQNNLVIREKARQEASLAYRHPNLVEMIGFCEYTYNNGPCFLISKYVNGEDIDKYLTKITAPEIRYEKVCIAIQQVLDALEYLHSKEVIHRDIKPSNIMVENESNVRLMDLGIARQNGGNKWSRIGFIGTPEYSAPEQICRAENDTTKTITKTTDFYALGITFYELLTGTNPMRCKTDVETLTKQMTVNLPPHPSIPNRMMKVIWKATEKEQAKRYQSAREFKEAIADALRTPPSLWEKIKSFMNDHKWIIVSAFVFVAILVVLVTLLII